MTEDEKNQTEAEVAEDAENEDTPPDSEAPEETAAEEGEETETGAEGTGEEAVEAPHDRLVLEAAGLLQAQDLGEGLQG